MFGKILAKTWNVVTQSLRVRGVRHSVLSSNIANVDTPGYRRKEVPFKEIMRSYLREDLTLQTTHPRHFSNLPGELKSLSVEPEDVGTPNNVSLEEEMSKLIENHLLYQATIEAFIKEIALIREAITEGGGK